MHEYLKWNAKPPNLSTSEKQTFKKKASCYAILVYVVYKWSYDGFLLCFLELYDQAIPMQTCHDDICGGNFNEIIIAKCILIMGYYWPTME